MVGKFFSIAKETQELLKNVSCFVGVITKSKLSCEFWWHPLATKSASNLISLEAIDIFLDFI